jgi:hypothetical protein
LQDPTILRLIGVAIKMANNCTSKNAMRDDLFQNPLIRYPLHKDYWSSAAAPAVIEMDRYGNRNYRTIFCGPFSKRKMQNMSRITIKNKVGWNILAKLFHHCYNTGL